MKCPPHPATREYMQNSVDRTTRWLERCKKKLEQLNSMEDTINKQQMHFWYQSRWYIPRYKN